MKRGLCIGSSGADAGGAMIGNARQPTLTPYLRRGSSEAMQRENIADPVKYLFSILPSRLTDPSLLPAKHPISPHNLLLNQTDGVVPTALVGPSHQIPSRRESWAETKSTSPDAQMSVSRRKAPLAQPPFSSSRPLVRIADINIS